ncbi:MAG: thiamine pyrophosphate-binding protein [Candidatus Nitrosopumilus sp. Bin_571-38]
MKASDLFVKCLENEGVEYIFGIPGEENADFMMSLSESKIKLDFKSGSLHQLCTK